MFVTIVNAVVLWPWTDSTKSAEVLHRGRVEIYDVYPVVNFFFILVYIAEFILKVCCPCWMLIFKEFSSYDHVAIQWICSQGYGLELQRSRG